MSIAGVGSTGISQLSNIQRNYQQVQGEFKQLGNDLQSGNLAQAQTDFVTLSQSAASQFGAQSPVTKTLQTIGQALQSSNLGNARQAFASLPVGVVGSCAEPNQGHVGTTQNALNQLGQTLQSGNLSTAQAAFAAMQHMWQQIAPNTVAGTSVAGLTMPASNSSINVTA